MGNDNSKENPNAYPHQQYQYDKQQQIAQQKKAKTHHQHHHHTDTIQPKPKPNPPPQQVQQVQQVQYVPVQTYPNQPVNPYYGAQQIPVQQPQPVQTAMAVNTAQNTIIQQPIQPQPIQQPQAQSVYPSLQKPAQQQRVQQVATTAAIAGTTATTAAIIANNNIQQQPQQQPTAPIAATGAIIASQQRPPPTNPNISAPVQQARYTMATQQQQIPVANPQYIQQAQYAQPQAIPQQQIQSGYVQIAGADGKQYLVPQGPPGTVPVVVEPKKKLAPKPVVKKKKKYKTWGVKVIPTSDKAKNKVRNQHYEHTTIVLGIVCEGDKYDGYNKHGGYGGYGYSSYGDMDQKKFITMKVKVTDQIAIQQNKEKHYLEFWKNGHMFNKVIALDPQKKFQIRVGSTNHDYDVKLY